ncbi:MAG TPA: helix-turn-helix transcriptional regulator [Pyrinomonadaceae bacterium]|nr:helix-turn-helix transcriptional regulator [Pyrinomonadaceae bacterium]
MGRLPSYRPERLGKKMVEIRRKLGLSQNGLIRHLGLSDELFQGDISAFELGNRTPDLRTLLLLAQAAGVYVDVLIDDATDLPKKIPAVPKSEGVRRKAVVKTGRDYLPRKGRKEG